MMDEKNQDRKSYLVIATYLMAESGLNFIASTSVLRHDNLNLLPARIYAVDERRTNDGGLAAGPPVIHSFICLGARASLERRWVLPKPSEGYSGKVCAKDWASSHSLFYWLRSSGGLLKSLLFGSVL